MMIDNAAKFVKAYEKSKIRFDCPVIHGYLNCKIGGGIFSSIEFCYFLLQSNQGLLIKFSDKNHFQE